MSAATEACKATARRGYAEGLCIVPPREDGTKEPDTTSWTAYQVRRPDRQQMKVWFVEQGRSGVGIITGAVSGNVELFEFDDADTYQVFKDTAEAVGLGDLVECIEAGYSESTPGGGIHWLYRCVEVGDTKLARNTKLARRPKRPDEMHDPDDKVKTLIETKANGGYAILAPTNGRVHPTGGAYRLLRGGVEWIPDITSDERTELFNLARAFDAMPKPEHRPVDELPPGRKSDGLRPGDDFNQRADWGRDVLEPRGWRRVYERGGITYWRRPGKDQGISASTNYAGSNLLYVFTTSTPFEPEQGYSPFRAYAILNHNADFATAAASLGSLGFGEPLAATPRLASASDHRPRTPQNATAQPPSTLAAVPLFPVTVIPSSVSPLIQQGSLALNGAPIEYIAVPFLAIVGAMIGGGARLRLKNSWEERAQLWVAVVGPPGSMKTPAQNLARRPLDVLQREAHERYQADLVRWEVDHDTWVARDKKDRGPEPPQPRLEHVYTSDVTLEGLASMLQHTPGLPVIRDELVSWVKANDAYRGGRGGDRSNWLSLWSGVPLKIDRKTSKPIYVPEPTVSVSGGIQPDMLPVLAEEAGRRDGFVERVAWTYPDPVPPAWTEVELPEHIIAGVANVLRQLRALPPGGVVTLAPDARAAWVAWFNENAQVTADTTGIAQGVSAKLPNLCARLALILHCLSHISAACATPLSLATMEDAITLAEYFRAHANRVIPAFGAVGTPRTVGLAARLHRILTHADGEWVSRSTINEQLSGHVAAADIEAALTGLLHAGKAEQAEKATGGRPVEQWRVVLPLFPLSPHDETPESDSVYEPCPACGKPLLDRYPSGNARCLACLHYVGADVEGVTE